MRDSHPELDEVIAELREPVAVRPAWREALLRQVEAVQPGVDVGEVDDIHSRFPDSRFPISRFSDSRLSIRPSLAIAASVALLCGGVWIGAAITPSRRAEPRAAVAATSSDGLTTRSLVTVRFLLVARNAGRVSVVGDFNGWNPGSTPMRRASDGQSWIAEVPLAPGRHVYAFVVDGDVVTDPAAPVAADEDFGVRNSVVLVSGSGT